MKKFALILALLMLIPCLSGCGEKILPQERPEDFSFSLIWGAYGTSSYDSRTGKLVKTTDATHPEDYVTYLHLSDETLDYFYGLLRDLDVESFPDEYDPDRHTMCEPSSALTVTVRAGGRTKTVRVDDMAASRIAYIGKCKKYIETCTAIRDFLMQTEEWKALPEYEFFYD
jgi:hypothetical protein